MQTDSFTPKQHKKTDWVYLPTGEAVQAGDLAEKVARICQGRWDWQGVREFEAPAGLTKLANAWLGKNAPKGSKVYERVTYSQDCVTLSVYAPYWER